MLEREFHRSFRGPDPSDEDTWRLTFDAKGQGLRVRHSWRTIRHSGAEDVTLEEVLAQPGEARDALLELLFDPTATPSAQTGRLSGEARVIALGRGSGGS